MFYYPQKLIFKLNDFDSQLAVDIYSTRRLATIVKEGLIASTPYVVLDGETPDVVSYKMYGSPNYDYMILLANDIFDVWNEWPRDSVTMESYIRKKYGTIAAAKEEIAFYYDVNKNRVDAAQFATLPTNARSSETFYEYEYRINDNKRKLKIPKTEAVLKADADLRSSYLLPIV